MIPRPDCGMLLKQIHDAIEKRANHDLKNSGLTLSQARFLMYLLERGESEIPAKDFESHFQVSQPTVVGILKRLEQKKLIVSSVDRLDRRVKNISLTSSGMELCHREINHQKQMEAMIVKNLSPEEIAAFRSALETVYENVR